MNRFFIVKCLTLIVLFLSSCVGDEVMEEVVEVEVFQRVDHSSFNYSNVNVRNIQAIGDKLMYSHRTNPGYIDQSGEVVQLCCSVTNHHDVRQAFSEKYIVTASADLSYFGVYSVDNSRHGFLNLNDLDPHKGKNPTLNFFMDRRNISINDSHLIASMREDREAGIFIYDIESTANFVGLIPDPNAIIKVDFSAFLDPDFLHDARIINVDPFGNGWIMSVWFNQTMQNNSFLVNKDGSVTKIESPLSNEPVWFTDYTVLDNGQLFMISGTMILVSRTGRIEDLQPLADTGNTLRVASVGNRLLIYHPSFHIISEVMGVLDEDAENYTLERLDDTNLTFSNINDIQVFRDKVYVATSMGLFTKSLDGFFDRYEEPEPELSQNWTNEVQWVGKK
ncbi:hypothetical protein KIH41_10530 [Litoribacter ruber]|uniref:hypothetical protein n=1 Tax=Litoribacter ruber TaxID=702568 RepID=UPI001BDAEAD7|nr:hypothetical protein [Litoribacter ruber]MBT0811711.1 hypothetical protein [Litoribacter ruber]